MAVKEIVVKEGEFTEYVKRPLISGDIGAYKIVLQTGYDLTSHSVRITAKRSDGVILEDIGTVSGQNAVYTLKSSIYSVEGEVEVRMIVGDSRGNCLTEKALIFDVISSHETGDMEKASDNGKSAADLALAHIYNMQDPHNTREHLGFDKVLADIGGKIDYEIIETENEMPDLQDADMGKLYLVYKKDDDWSIDNTDAIRYDVYIKTESVNDENIYAWTKFTGNVSDEGHTHSSADITDVDTVPTSGSNKLVASDGVAKELAGKKSFNQARYVMSAESNSGSWIRIAKSLVSSGSTSVNFTITRGYNDRPPECVVFNVSICNANNKCSVTQLSRTVADANVTYSNSIKIPKVRVISINNIEYIDVFYIDTNRNDVIITCNDGGKEYELNTSLEYSKPTGYTLLKEFEFSSEGIKADKINGLDLADEFSKKLDKHDASISEYETGRLWIDGQPIYRVDFSAFVYYGEATWDNGYILSSDLITDNTDINIIIEAEAVQTLAYISQEGKCQGDGLRVSPVKIRDGGVFFDTDYSEGDCDGIIISGYIEYVKNSIDLTDIPCFD